MPHAVPMASPGLQALILCGPGSNFPTFTANPDENPKALLPIANRPMVWYPIDFCYRAGITNITLICPPTAAEAIRTSLDTNPYLTGLPLPRPDLLAPANLDQNTGTAEILRLPEVKEIVTSDFVVLPCDLVCELGGDKLLQAWYVKSASLGDLLGDASVKERSGGLGVWYETKTTTPVKGEETDFVATVPQPHSAIPAPKGSLLPNLSNVVYSMPTDSLKDLTDEKTGFPIRHGLLRRHPRIRMLTTHRDAHIYIFPHWVMDFISENERLESIGEDVIGWWAKATWQSGLSEKLGFRKILGMDKQQGEEPSSANDTATPSEEGGSDGDDADLSRGEQTESRPNLGRKESGNSVKEEDGIVVPPMLAYIHPSSSTAPSNPLVRRVDTAKLLLAISLELAKLPSVEEVGAEAASPFAHARKVAYPEGVKQRTTITKADSLVDNNVTVQEKTSIKESVIGANCQIGEGAKLQQCVLMEGVVIGKNCKLTKCILGKRSEIGDGSILTDVEVQENLYVEPKTEEKDTKLMSSEGLEATEEELQEVLDQDDGAGDEEDGEP